MLSLYLVSLIIGGGLLLFSIVGGSDGDLDADFDADLDVDADIAAAVDAGSDMSAHSAPAADIPLLASLLSLCMWTFVATFFGLFGTLGTWLAVGSSGSVLLWSIVCGVTMGLLTSLTFGYLKRHQLDSSVRSDDWIGAHAEVLLPISPGEQGQVRITVGGQFIDLPASSSQGESLPTGATAIVVQYLGDRVVVESMEKS